MNILRVKGIEKDFLIEPGKIYCINIENRLYYLNLLNSFVNNNTDNIFYIEDNKSIEFYKKSICITDIFNISPNSKKIINSLYKRINDEIIDQNSKENIQLINKNIIEMLENISLNLNLSVEYELDLDISKILSLYKFTFKEDQEELKTKIITYIKANMEICNLSFVVMFNILQLLDDSDLELVQKELELLNISIININFVGKSRRNSIDYLTIDDDLCEF